MYESSGIDCHNVITSSNTRQHHDNVFYRMSYLILVQPKTHNYQISAIIRPLEFIDKHVLIIKK